MEFITSSKGKRQLVFEGYKYNKQKDLKDDAISWECVSRRNEKSCKAKVKALNDQIIGQTNEHTLPPIPELIDAAKARSEMKRRAETTTERKRNIISQSIQNQNDVLPHLPSTTTMGRTIRRQQQRVNVLPPIPAENDLFFNIPQEYQIASNGNYFLQADIIIGQ